MLRVFINAKRRSMKISTLLVHFFSSYESTKIMNIIPMKRIPCSTMYFLMKVSVSCRL